MYCPSPEMQAVLRRCFPDPADSGSPGFDQAHLIEHIGNCPVPQFGPAVQHLLIGQAVIKTSGRGDFQPVIILLRKRIRNSAVVILTAESVTAILNLRDGLAARPGSTLRRGCSPPFVLCGRLIMRTLSNDFLHLYRYSHLKVLFP